MVRLHSSASASCEHRESGTATPNTMPGFLLLHLRQGCSPVVENVLDVHIDLKPGTLKGLRVYQKTCFTVEWSPIWSGGYKDAPDILDQAFYAAMGNVKETVVPAGR